MEVRHRLEKMKKTLLRRHRAIGIGIGYKYVDGKRTDRKAIIFYVRKKLDVKELEKRGIKPVPRRLFGIETDVLELPEGFTPLSERKKHRPFSGGVSGISFREEGATGTLGYVSSKGEVLSNNHVMANESLTTSRTAEKGDPIIQPGYYDGGRYPEDVVAHLDRWVDLKPLGEGTCPFAKALAKFLNFWCWLFRRKGRFIYYVEEENFIDGAVAVAVEGLWKEGFLDLGCAEGTLDYPELGMKVQKQGRTTSITKGTVVAVGVTVDVGKYQGVYTCRFADQFSIEGDEGSFSEPGDSGSVIATLDEPLRLVGLLFAGGRDSTGRMITIASPWKYVKQYLKFEI